MPPGVGYPMMQGFGQPQQPGPIATPFSGRYLSPEMLAQMALRNPDLAGRVAASTGQGPPPVPQMKPGMQGPPTAQGTPPQSVGEAVAPAAQAGAGNAPDPNALGLALAGVQGIQGQQQGPPGPISPQQFGGQAGTGAQALLQLLGMRPGAPGLGR